MKKESVSLLSTLAGVSIAGIVIVIMGMQVAEVQNEAIENYNGTEPLKCCGSPQINPMGFILVGLVLLGIGIAMFVFKPTEEEIKEIKNE